MTIRLRAKTQNPDFKLEDYPATESTEAADQLSETHGPKSGRFLSQSVPPNIQRKCATSAVASGKKVAASRVLLHSAGRSFSGVLLCRDRMDFGASGTDDLVGGAEDFLSAFFRYRFRVRTTATGQPMLDIAARIIGSRKAQRFAAK